MRPLHVVVAALQYAGQRLHAVPETVNEAAGGLLEVQRLGNGSGEVEIGYADRFPGVCEVRKTVLYDQIRAAFLGEYRRIEAESGGQNDPVVRDVFDDLPDAGEADAHHISAVGIAFDTENISVEDRIL